MEQMIEKFENLEMLTLGAGLALAGSALVTMGVTNFIRRPYGAMLCMGFGATIAPVGSQIALGAIERIRGRQ